MNTEVIFVGCSSTHALYKAHIHMRSTHRVIHPILAELSMRVKKGRRRERERREDNLYAFDPAGRNMDRGIKKVKDKTRNNTQMTARETSHTIITLCEHLLSDAELDLIVKKERKGGS